MFHALFAMLFYVTQPVVDMRESPNDQSKVISQVIFSEEIKVGKEMGQWAYISSSDGYKGWVPHLAIVSRDAPYNGSIKVSRLMAHLYDVKDTEYGPIETLPYGSKLELLDPSDERWAKVALPNGREGYIQKGDVSPEQVLQKKEDLVLLSQKFLGLPYTWGGRSSFGYDCSGFIQMLYSQIGIYLERDSRQQILDPHLREIHMEDLEPGDLIFFGKSEQKIMHVGMYIGDDGARYMIHSSARELLPWLRISKLTDREWAGQSDAYYPYRTFRQLKKY